MSNNPLVPRFGSCLAVFAQKNVPGLHNLIHRYRDFVLHTIFSGHSFTIH